MIAQYMVLIMKGYSKQKYHGQVNRKTIYGTAGDHAATESVSKFVSQ